VLDAPDRVVDCVCVMVAVSVVVATNDVNVVVAAKVVVTVSVVAGEAKTVEVGVFVAPVLTTEMYAASEV